MAQLRQCLSHTKHKIEYAGCEIVKTGHIVSLQVHELSESLLFGWPNILIPHADSFDSIQDMEANEQCFIGLCQVGFLQPCYRHC